MKDIAIVSKTGGSSNNLPWGDIQVSNLSSVIKIPASPNDIRLIERSGQNLVISTKSGETITLQGYFNTTADGAGHDVVFEDNNGALWHAEYVPSTSSYAYKEISAISDLLIASTSEASGAGWLWPLLGAAGVGVAISESSGGNENFVRLNKPLTPTNVTINEEGTQIIGRAEPGTTVIVRGADGNIIGQSTVGVNGEFQVVLQPPQHNGESITVVVRNPDGQESDPITIVAPVGESEEQPGEEEEPGEGEPGEGTAPEAPTDLSVHPEGSSLTGRGQPRLLVRVHDPEGNMIGSGMVDDDGNFTIALDPAQTNGQLLTVTKINDSGQVSPAALVNAPVIDNEAPDAPTDLAINANGTTLTGRGEPGTLAEVRGPNGNIIGTGTVAANGTFTVTLSPAQSNGQLLSVTLTDTSNQTSLPATINAPFVDNGGDVAPNAPTNLIVSGDGTSLSGRGQSGTQVQVRGVNGEILGTGTVAPNGTFSVALQPPQTDGQLLSVTLTNSLNLTSLAATVSAPDIDGSNDDVPAPATGLVVSPDGSSVSGTGEPGATVTITDQDGNEIGTGIVAPDGSFDIEVSPPQINGETLTVVLGNANGDSEPATIVAPDTTAPNPPEDVVIATDGSGVSGTGEPGTTVIIRDSDGNDIATGEVDEDGNFNVPLNPPLTNGEVIDVVLVDDADNESDPVSATAPNVDTGDDVPAPATGLAVSPDGNSVSGTGEPGATVTITDQDGNEIGTGIVAPDGSFDVEVSPPQTNGETLTVVLGNANGDSEPATIVAPDTTAPNAPEDVVIATDGSGVSGTGEPGTTVIIRDSDGNDIATGEVDEDGNFNVPLNPPLTNGEVIDVVLVDDADNESDPVSATAPNVDTGDDVPAPATGLAVSPDGSSVTGTGEAGATVTISDPDGNEIGTGTVQPDGSFTVAIAPPQVNGETLTVVLGNANGDSDPATVVAPNVDTGDDVPAPATGLAVSPDGSSVTGTGEAGATVTISDPDGNEIGTGTVQPDGSFTVAIAPPQVNGETLTVVLGNANGDSDPATVVAPNVDTGDDVPAPATGLAVSPDGSSVTGTGEAGATVTISDPDGNEIGTGTVQPDGSFTVAIAPPQVNGETLTVVLGNANGDSDPATVVAPNVDTGDDVPAPATGLAVSPDGSSVTGTGEAGATVTISDPDGNEIGTGTVQPDGSFTVAIAPPQVNGETLTVVLGNANGDSDPATVVAPNVDTGDDVPAPATGLAVSPDGSSVTGTGEAGATVTISDPDGNEIGTGTVQPDGSFTVAIAPPQVNGETLTVVLGNANGDSDPATVVAPNVDTGDDVPAPATGLAVSPDGSSVTGTGEAGATVTISDPDGNEIGTGTVQPDGSFTVAIAPPQVNGETLTVVLGNANGDSDPATVVAPNVDTGDDVPAPATGLAVSPDGSSVTGTGEAGATVTISDPDGNEIGTGTVQPDGSFTVAIAPPQVNGETLTVVLGNANGDSDPATVVAPNVDTGDDVPAPATGLAVSPDGSSVTGTGEAGATVTISDPDGNEIGTGTVQPDGSFTVAIAPPQVNGETLTVVLGNANGDSDPATVVAPNVDTGDDVPAPATGLAVSPDGSSVTGTGEAGATVTISDPDGNEIGTGTVQPDGSFTVAIAPPQVNGETLTVVLGNANGDSDPATVVAPNVDTGDDVPAPATGLAVSPDGSSVTGTGEAGATVTISDPDGNEIGTGTVQPDGSFTVAIAPPQVNGETLTVVLGNANGDSDPATVVAPNVDTGDDVPAPATGLAVSPDGSSVTGTGEAGATVTISDPDGNEIGTGTVQPDGSFTVAIAPPQVNGETLTVVLGNANGDSDPATVVAPNVDTGDDVPAPATGLAVSPDGSSVTGTGEAGATVTISDPDGNEIGTGTVQPDGSFTVAIAPPQVNGETLTVVLGNANGDSDPATVVAPNVDTGDDVPAPATGLAVSPDGSSVTGTGEAGATVTISDPDGNEIGTGTVQPDGSFTVAIAPPQVNGETLTVVLGNANGDSDPATVVAPNVDTGDDVPAPATGLAVSPDGSSVTGTGEAGATVTISDPDGNEIGTGTVQPDGSFTVAIAPPQVNGETLTVVLGNANGDSDPATVVAPNVDTGDDVPAPATGLAVSPDGSSVTGTGEAGATVTISDPDGNEIGTGTVQPDGSFTVAIAPPQVNGETLTVVLGNANGDSDPATVVAPNVDTGDDVPAPATGLAVSPDGSSVTGTGEAGATVTISDPDGNEIGTGTVQPDGSFTVAIAPPQVNGETLTVVLGNANGDSDPATVVAPNVDTGDDVPAPATGLAVSPDGSSVTGTGEAGATVTISDPDGNEIGTGTVQPDGSFTVAIAPPQVNGETLTVVLGNANGDSDPATVVAPNVDTGDDVPAPATGLAVSPDGSSVTGTGEAGATVTISDPDGNEIGTGTVQPDGSFTVAIAPPQVNGETLTVVLGNANGDSDPATVVAPNVDTGDDVPAPATGLAVSPDGSSVTGTGEAGATVTISDPDGNEIGTGTVQPDGSFTVAIAPPQVNGETLTVVLGNANGDSDPATVVAPNVDTGDDVPAPATGLAVSPDGSSVTGTGEAGATVTISDPDGNEIGTGTVQPDGSFTVAIAPPQVNGETLTVVLGNANGDSDPATVVAPNVDTGDDVPAPATGLAVSPDGSSVTGTGEAGATVTISDPDGNEIGTGTVQPDGSFTVAIAPPQVNGETLTVVLGNANGDSDPATVVAPNVDTGDDVPAPATGLAVSPDGSSVTGTGEAGATVTISDPDGNEIGTGTVQPDGSFTVAIAPPQVNGETLTVVLGNANGDSDPATVVAPNVDTGDDVPAPATGLAVSPDGSSVTGTGEAGATVTISDPDGNEIGTGTVQPDGSFTVAIAPPQVNGETLTVVLGNANGDSDPATVVAPNVDTGDDVPAPATGLAVSPDGSSVTGTGEAGATVTISDPDGNEIGTGTVQPDGSFTVAIAPPQVNGETLTVVLGNANGDSDPATVVAPNVDTGDDVPAPATGLAVSPDGSSVTGTGEAGATVTISDPDGNEIGTGTVQPDGSFTVAIAPPQVNGETLTVVLGNANGDSDPATVVAPNVDTGDDVPAPATGLAVSPDGSSVTGTGEAGATVTISDPDGNEIGTGTVQPDGSFTVAIAPPQVNGETLTVVLGNANGDSDPATVVAPNVDTGDDVPAPATGLAVSPDGSSVTGTGEAGATVTISDPDGNEIGTGTVQPDGSFTVAIAPPQVNGETLTVVLGNANGDSDPATIVAPVVEPIEAFDNLASASVNLQPTITSGINTPNAVYPVLLNLLGVVDLQILSTPNILFEVEHGHTSDIRLTYNSLVDLSALSALRVVVQVKDENGVWSSLSGDGEEATLLSLTLLSGGANGVNITGLPSGEYRAFVAANGVADAALFATLSGVRTDYDFTNITGSTSVNVSGNVLTDGTADTVTDDTVVYSVNGTEVPEEGTTITGLYGVLTIGQDGSYTYVPGNEPTNIGKVDIFNYVIRDTVTNAEDSANLHIRIDSNSVDLVWDAPDEDATTGLDAVDDVATAAVNYRNVTLPAQSSGLGSFETSGFGTKTGSTTATFIIEEDISSSVILSVGTTASLGSLSVLPTFTILLQKWNTATSAWENVPGGSVSGTGLVSLPIVGLGLQVAVPGQLEQGEYRVTASISTIAVFDFTSNVRISRTDTLLDEYEVNTNPGVTGNVLDGDTLGSVATKLLVNVDGTFTEVTNAGLTVAGTHGTLIIQKDGSYVYTPGSAHHPENVTETFEYQLRHPNGTTAEANLEITLEVSGAGVVIPDEPFGALVAGDELDIDLGLAANDNEENIADDGLSVSLDDLISDPESGDIELSFDSDDTAPPADTPDAVAGNATDNEWQDPVLVEPIAQNDDLWNQPDNQLG